MSAGTPERRSSSGEISAEVVEACRRGDRDAFRSLYEAYKDRVYSIAYYFFHADADAAGEVTQQVFLKLMRGLGKFRGDATFSTWLYRLVVNACVDRSHADMAAALNCSIGTVASRLSRGHRLLAKKLAPMRSAELPRG